MLGREGNLFADRFEDFHSVRHAAERDTALFAHLGYFLQEEDVAGQALHWLNEE
jgi:hypothetical protein